MDTAQHYEWENKKKEYDGGVGFYWKLYSQNKFEAINALIYSLGPNMFQCDGLELNQFETRDAKTRKGITTNGKHHQEADLERPNLSRRENNWT